MAKLIPYGRNPRKNDHAVKQMVACIKEFGFKVPILAKSSGEIVDGHLRFKAAQALGLKTVPVMLCDEWTDAQVKAFRIMVNKSTEWAEWDKDLLKLELGDLQALDSDLAFTGLEKGELAPSTDLQAELQDVPLPAPAVTWVLMMIPTAQYGAVSEQIEALAKIDGVRCEISLASHARTK